MAYDLEKMRAQLRAATSGHARDPHEFIFPKCQDERTPIRYRAFILPPLSEGDACYGGKASKDMGTFFLQSGSHWFERKPYPCPRMVANEPCAACDFGFKLLKDAKAKDDKVLIESIRGEWLPDTVYVVNLFFPSISTNPEDVRGKVLWCKAKKTLFDKWEAAICRDNAGDDPEQPEAYGCFFDEMNAFPFQIEIVKKKGKSYNDYTGSKFIAAIKGEMANGPIAKTPSGEPDIKMIKQILAQRHDLYTKIGTPDKALISRIVARMVDGDDSAVERHEEPEEEPVVERQTRQATRTTRTQTAPAVEPDSLAEEAPLHQAPKTTTRPARPAAEDAGPDVNADPGDDTDEELANLMNQLSGE